jgi:hypothetical protein
VTVTQTVKVLVEAERVLIEAMRVLVEAVNVLVHCPGRESAWEGVRQSYL